MKMSGNPGATKQRAPSQSRATGTKNVRSVERAAKLLSALAIGQDHGRRLVDIAEELGLPAPSVHRLLKEMIEQGLAEKPAHGHRYFLGQEVFFLGLARRNRFPLKAAASPYLDELASALGETVFLTQRNRRDSICIDRQIGTHPVKILYVEIGNRRPLGASVGGIALMRTMAEDEIEAILLRNQGRYERFGCSSKEVLDRILRCQSCGYADLNIELENTGYRGIAVPIVTAQQETIGAIGLGALASRMDNKTVAHHLIEMQKRASMIVRDMTDALSLP
ncbi:DNA-binding IclR family transcriptional regulator [Collimonas sp. PA-H2]|uniref:IclR family transcriptional regulator n=1 Tax=Collimonas sp. PA-H2 TaxID=1881062 RepID=UPI000C016E5D|nr:IclR family transcriptional regulator [Collimonas sp. PA-H2]PFH09046.1 DNA-binding IclR family transcriptional regulator [Collimonas sp. PA-H2]